MKYFFIFGNHPALSACELAAVLPEADFIYLDEKGAVLDSPEKIDADKLIHRLGGVVKMGEAIAQIGRDKDEAAAKIVEVFTASLEKSGKIPFGVSSYAGSDKYAKAIGLEAKKALRADGFSVRLAISQDSTLSSAAVDKNKLLEKGIEFVLLPSEDKSCFWLGKTTAIQPFKELSYRDYGRPGRDDHSGMLPPKLAQLMINLSGIKPGNVTLIDPFCGSGTVITEAMLMGYKHLAASDISLKAVQDTETNIDWIKEKFSLSDDFEIKTFQESALELEEIFPAHSIDVIVTEPYLGPQRGEIYLDVVTKELNEMYSGALIEFKKILKPGGRVVMVWPAFSVNFGKQVKFRYLDPNINGFRILPSSLDKDSIPKMGMNERGHLFYGREGQRVWREIIILESC